MSWQQQQQAPYQDYSQHPYPGYPPPPPQPRYDQYPPQYHHPPPPPHPYQQLAPSPPPQHHLYAPPPPADDFRAPPDVAVDPNSFRRFFMHHLSTLTFNSKPVITNLTLFAHHHLLRMSTVVASCLEEHLRTCSPANRLPTLYLLDSISKNIGPPYIVHFCRFIERAFLSAYHVVDGPTKVKMEELLGTWRTGGSDGGELFRMPEEGRAGRVQHGIETALFGMGGRGGGIGAGGRPLQESDSYASGMQQLPTSANTGERSGVLFDVRRLLQLRQDQAILQPEDAVNKHQVGALQKLENLVLNTQLTSDQVHQIREQLHALAPRDHDFGVAVKAESPSLTSATSTFSALHPPLPPLSSGSRSTMSPPPLPDLTRPVADPSTVAAPLQTPSAANPPPVLANPLAPTLQGIDLNLLAQLKGLAGVSGGLSGLLASTAATAAAPPPVASAPVDRLVQDYDDALVTLDVHLTNSDILKPRPEASAFLYGRFGLQCKQCGLRFFDTKIGKKKMDVHLDSHFTHKRRIREGAGRAQGRSWLSYEEDWIHSDEVDVLYEPAEASSTAKADAQQIDRAELLLRKVVAPSDTNALAKACPVCKEKFKSDWSEQDEDWVFYNAVEVDGVIYHATCHAEAASARLASRLRLDESTRPSRETTPAMAPLLATVAKSSETPEAGLDGAVAGVGASGLKRKAESDDDEMGREGEEGEAGRAKRPKSEPVEGTL